jgi:pyrimidine-nucleoside phosphorylase
MNAIEIITKKRDGERLAPEEIAFFVREFTTGAIPDYQAAAWLMAVVLRGMDFDETAALTEAIVRSGSVLDLSAIAPFIVDKHSTGGVGDKTTLVVAPLVSACGLPVAKMSGRALGFTGGTLDKLESIPGFRSDLTKEQFLAQVREHGIVVAGQSADLAPADGKLYALRDVTATVEAIPLIASSIMSKKIASGANGIVLDVKVGRGAFMHSEENAVRLADTMVSIGKSLGRRITAVLSGMDQPLGNAVGNGIEVLEALDTLKGEGPEDFRLHCLTIASEMLRLGRPDLSPVEAMQLLDGALRSGAALKKFREFVSAQGGDTSALDRPGGLPVAKYIATVPADRSGTVASIDAMEIGLTAAMLGAGRTKKGDRIDYAVGIVLHRKVGGAVEVGSPLFTVHANDALHLEEARERVQRAIVLSAVPVQPPALIRRIIRDSDPG